MKKFSEFIIGESFYSTCSISDDELEEYLKFSRIKNVFLENKVNEGSQLVSGRAILSRMEGEFTRLNQIYGNQIIFSGTDGDTEWGNRNTRFLKPLYTSRPKPALIDENDVVISSITLVVILIPRPIFH